MESCNTRLYRAPFLIFLLGSFLFIGASQATEESSELTFLEKLALQEKQEHQILIERIRSMPQQEYREFLQQRVDSAYENNAQSLRTITVVDVTDEMNQPEPGFIARLFSSQSDQDEFGVEKIERQLQAVGEVFKKSINGVKSLLGEHKSSNTQRHYQRVDGLLSRQAAELLIYSEDVVDFHVADPKYPAWSSITQVDDVTGRVFPPKTIKQYDDAFLNAGLYEDVRKSFESSDVSIVQVNLHEHSGPEVATTDNGGKAVFYPDTEEFLESWSQYEFNVLIRGASYVTLQTTKPHVEAMKEDSRVTFIRLDKAFTRISKP